MADSAVEEDKPVKVDKWDHNALKNALDDAVRKIFTKNLSYEENFKIMDGRLIISTVAVAFSLIALAYDFLFPFPASKWVLAFCSVSYFITVSILTLYLWWVERGIFLVFHEGKHLWNISSVLKKYDDMYTLTLKRHQDGSSTNVKDQVLSKSVAEFFDDKGNLCFDKFQEDVLKTFRSISNKKTN